MIFHFIYYSGLVLYVNLEPICFFSRYCILMVFESALCVIDFIFITLLPVLHNRLGQRSVVNCTIEFLCI